MSDRKNHLPEGPVRAEIRLERGAPRLYINGEITVPVMFAAIHDPQYRDGTEKTYETVVSQMERASRAGNRIIRTVISFPIACPEAVKQSVDDALSLIISRAPDSYILLSYSAGSDAAGIPGASVERDHFCHQTDKVALNMMNDSDEALDTHAARRREDFCSLASVPWIEQAKRATAELVRYVRSVPEYARRVIGYMPCAGSAGEWFGPLFFEGATDCSPANTEGFRAFLSEKYGTDQALQAAWDQPEQRLCQVEIPENIPGAGIERIKWEAELSQTLILTPEYRPYADYEDYYSGMVADRIAALCQVVKEESHGESLGVSFYGYHSEVRVPFSGSFGLYRILKSKAVDILAGPVSYKDRDLGGMGAYMSPVASIHAAGKLWMDEGDYRTHFRSGAGFMPDGTQEGVGDWIPCLSDEEATLEVQRRQFGKDMVHGSGVWWFDLVYRGWFDYDAFWKESVRLSRLAEWFCRRRGEESPDVAIVYDEEALSLLGQPWQYGEDMLNDIRLMLYRMGYAFGMYTGEDIAQGKAPDAKLLLFLTPWRIGADLARRLKPQIAGKTACWCYGRGETEPEIFEKLTGFRLAVLPGAEPQKLLFNEDGAFSGAQLELRRLCPVYAAENGTPLARYSVSTGAAAAETEINGCRSFFLGGTSLSAQLYCILAELAGAHRYFSQEDVSYHNSRLAVLHAGSAGKRTLQLPEETDVYDYFGKKEYRAVREITFDTRKGQTHYFFLGCGERPPEEEA